MNKVTLIGNLTKDIELNKTSTGVAVIQFTLAVKRPHNAEATDFVRCVAWRKTAELMHDYLSKGKKVAISGFLQCRKYDDDNGVTHYVTEVIVDSVEFFNSKTEGHAKIDDLPPAEDDGDLPF